MLKSWFPRLLSFAMLLPPLRADLIIFHGKVVMDDGSPPGRPVIIQRMCRGFMGPHRETNASPATGAYYVRLNIEVFDSAYDGRWRTANMLHCYLEASAPGFTSTQIDIGSKTLGFNPQLPNIVLSRASQGALVDLTVSQPLPSAGRKSWDAALKSVAAKNWAAAATALRAVVAAAPGFSPAWAALGGVLEILEKLPDARAALVRARELEPKRLPIYQALARVQIGLQDWAEAARTSDAAIQIDSEHRYLDAYLDSAVAHYQQKDYESALARLNTLIELDKRHELPRAEYVLGAVLEAKGDLDAAATHLNKYLNDYPRAGDAAAVKERLANLGKHPQADLSAEAASAPGFPSTAGEAAVPGGMKAFAAIAQMAEPPTYQDFFLQYCRAIVGFTAATSTPTREVAAEIRAFIAAVPELEKLGERVGDGVVIRLSTDTEAARAKTQSVLELMGWKLVPAGQGYDIELGDSITDSLRQRIPAAFGIDELQLRDTIAAGKPFQFEIPIENARLMGGAAWSATLRVTPSPSQGPIDQFLSDWRFARAYSGLGAMDDNTAAAVASSVGLVSLISRFSEAVARYGIALQISGSSVVLPGGADAEPLWLQLAGASPRKPAAFFRALLEKDRGALLPFFFDVWRADAAHQKFLTATVGRGEAFYRWYRDSGPAPDEAGRWQARILQKLRLGADGSMQLPGGRDAWLAAGARDDEALLRLPSLEPLAAAIGLEEKRARPLDAGSVKLLAKHFEEWRHVFPYLEKLPGLGEAEFRALEGFAAAAAGAPAPQRSLLIGEWHSLVELIILGHEAGSLDAAQSAAAFAQICEALRSANPSARALASLREIAGGSGDLDDAVATRLLRLSGARKDAFERVKQVQGVPPLASAGVDPRRTLAALSGAVYAATLSPEFLLVAEDPRLLAKHDFVPGADKPGRLFADSGLAVSSAAPGSHLSGGFGRLRETTAALDLRRAPSEVLPASGGMPSADAARVNPPSASVPGPDASTETTFHASGRIVEVYATVTDSRGRYVDDLNEKSFTVQVEGHPTTLFAFENRTTSVSVALLFDTTGSMTATLPTLKRAALQLIGDLRPDDSAAVYAFNDRVIEFQSFTTDKAAMKRAVLRAHPAGTTALYDALVRVSRDLVQRQGKKVILVFTDGIDNASMLTADAAIFRAKSSGIPIYTIAQGEARQNPALIKGLADLSHATGGAPFLIHKLSDIGAAFHRVSEDLMHGYLLAFQPPPAAGKAWNQISVSVPGRKGVTIRARDGYNVE